MRLLFGISVSASALCPLSLTTCVWARPVLFGAGAVRLLAHTLATLAARREVEMCVYAVCLLFEGDASYVVIR